MVGVPFYESSNLMHNSVIRFFFQFARYRIVGPHEIVFSPVSDAFLACNRIPFRNLQYFFSALIGRQNRAKQKTMGTQKTVQGQKPNIRPFYRNFSGTGKEKRA